VAHLQAALKIALNFVHAVNGLAGASYVMPDQ
jgi:hypothetical protein